MDTRVSTDCFLFSISTCAKRFKRYNDLHNWIVNNKFLKSTRSVYFGSIRIEASQAWEFLTNIEFILQTHRCRETGSVIVHNPDGGRAPDLRHQMFDQVVRAIEDDPTDSSRHVAARLSHEFNIRVSHQTVLRILKEDGQHAYHYRRVQELRKLSNIV